MSVTVQQVQDFLFSLAPDSYPEDRIHYGDPQQQVTSIAVCWFANRLLRERLLHDSADLIVMHEVHQYEQAGQDANCPAWQDFPINREAMAFYERNNIAIIRCHRTLDAHCIPDDFAAAIGLGDPIVREGFKGYHYTQLYASPAPTFGQLAQYLKSKLKYTMVRTSPTDPSTPVRMIGNGWGGVSGFSNLQYIERVREHGADVIVGGEIDEYALEYYRDVGLGWIELGHYASEIIGLRRAASLLQTHFPKLRVFCHEDDGPRVAYM